MADKLPPKWDVIIRLQDGTLRRTKAVGHNANDVRKATAVRYPSATIEAVALADNPKHWIWRKGRDPD